jgi:hypothetical protein
MRSSRPRVPGCIARSDAVPAPAFSGVVDLGVPGFPQLVVPAYRLGAGEGQRRAGMVVG